jgi:hypothetical protein
MAARADISEVPDKDMDDCVFIPKDPIDYNTEICAICLEKLQNGTNLAYIYVCFHCFHLDCAIKCGHQCPLCRTNGGIVDMRCSYRSVCTDGTYRAPKNTFIQDIINEMPYPELKAKHQNENSVFMLRCFLEDVLENVIKFRKAKYLDYLIRENHAKTYEIDKGLIGLAVELQRYEIIDVLLHYDSYSAVITLLNFAFDYKIERVTQHVNEFIDKKNIRYLFYR